jgi:hypothetical protein
MPFEKAAELYPEYRQKERWLVFDRDECACVTCGQKPSS